MTRESTDRPRKSDLARQRILEAARRVFSAEGYERATIRAVAADAQINPSMVIRYYGSKEGLFAAVAHLDFKTVPLTAVAPAELGQALVRHVLGLWEDPREGAALAAMMRASITNEDARARIVAQFSVQIGGLFAAVGASIAPAAPFIATQILGLVMARYLWRIPAIADLSAEAVVERVGPAVQRYIDDALVEAKGGW
jgi:AcrR family transcriptional regulator